MREGEEQEPEEGGDQKPKKRIDLSMSQVVGCGLATLTAAAAASYLGVYGTIIGTAVMSVLSTAGTAVIQHFVQKSGDRAKDIAERAKARPGERGHARSAATRALPRPSAVADVDTRLTTSTENQEPAGTHPERETEDTSATRAFPTGPPNDQDETSTLGAVPAGDGDQLWEPRPADATWAMPAAGDSGSPREPEERDSDNASGGGRPWWGGWRPLLIPALAIFVLAMLVILAFELFTGRSLTDTVRGNDTQSGPTLLGGYAEQQEEPADEPAPGNEEPEGPEGDRPDPDAPDPEAPGGETDRPGREPGTGESGDPGGQTPNPGTGEDDGQQDAPDQDGGQQDAPEPDGGQQDSTG